MKSLERLPRSAKLCWGLLPALCLLWPCTVQAQPPAAYEGLLKDMLGTVEEITTILVGITDENTAKDAAPMLKLKAEKMLDLRKKADELKQPDKATKDRLAKEYAPKFEAAVKKLRAESLRVEGIPGGDMAVRELAILKDKKDAKDKKKGDK